MGKEYMINYFTALPEEIYASIQVDRSCGAGLALQTFPELNRLLVDGDLGVKREF